MRKTVWARDDVKLREVVPGYWTTTAGGRVFDLHLLDGTWVVYVDGVERFSAFRLEVAQDKIVGWLAQRGATGS